MRRLFFFIPLSILMLGLCTSSPLLATTRGIRVTTGQGKSVYLYKDYHALVVGVSNYERWPRLPNAIKDAGEVAAKLTELGLKVRLVTDPTAREMQTLFSELVYDMGREEDRAILFYYAGHGETETLADGTKMGYLIPKDCPILEKNPKGFATHAISMRDIETASLRIKAKHVLMLFDSCFSGSLFALVRAVPDDITEKSVLPVRQYITAGREDEQVPDKSMFKRCLLIGLDGDADLTGDGYITGTELGMYLSDKVVNYTHRQQHPQYGKINNPELDRGDFIFVSEMDLEAKSGATKEGLRREIEEKGALRAEIERLKAQLGEKHLAPMPKEGETPIIPRVKLRNTPKDLRDYDVKMMLEKYNFLEKNLNESGDFPNDLADNGDGTITDRATGLMWEKGGSSSPLYYYKAKEHVSRLNRENFSGYSNWRIPTLEELWSLLEPGVNERGQHISSIFTDKQSKCWSVDLSGSGVYRDAVTFNWIVDFAKGRIDEIGVKGHYYGQGPERSFVRAVRSID